MSTSNPAPAHPRHNASRGFGAAWLIHSSVALGLWAFLPCKAQSTTTSAGAHPGAPDQGYHHTVQPILREFCFDCHGDGVAKGRVSFDQYPSDEALMQDRELWQKVLRNVRAGLMPPDKKPQPSRGQKARLESWIKQAVFLTNPADPDPGRVTVRRLNRAEYRNTIRDLMGVDFDTETEFPPDDTGHGFDTNGDVLTLSPMLLEKYLAAASSIVGKAVPTVSRAPAERVLLPGDFRRTPGGANGPGSGDSLFLSFYESGRAGADLGETPAGQYRFHIDLHTTERYVDGQNDYNRARLSLRAGGRTVFERAFNREGNRQFRFESELRLETSDTNLVVEVEPLTADTRRIRDLGFRINSVTRVGPLDPARFVAPPNYHRYFPEPVPGDAAARERYARRLLAAFASRAFRRPVDNPALDRLVHLATDAALDAGASFEGGIARAMIATLASPRFLFREEFVESTRTDGKHLNLDEPALASRLSYFLWSSMPDDGLARKAAAGQLRSGLAAEVQRMVRDPKSQALFQNFTGQWLQARDVESIAIEARTVLTRELPPDPELDRVRSRFRHLRGRNEDMLNAEEKLELEGLRKILNKRSSQPLRADLHAELRRSMRRETEMTFGHVVREDRSVLELLDADYTFLNEDLAHHYGLTNLHVRGSELQRVALPPDSPRGGLLTQGTVLVVTSNPTRTSPVKRGLFILENILGTPPPPAPPNIPPLEDVVRAGRDPEPSLREAIAIHREQPLCRSCHNRMDPPGLALENFNAMGMWRDQERGRTIDPAGTLLSGESFSGVRELKRILVTRHRTEFYRTLTEKLLTYAIGRGLDYYDTETVDRIVARLEADGGRFSALLLGIVESAPFQKRRNSPLQSSAAPAETIRPSESLEPGNP